MVECDRFVTQSIKVNRDLWTNMINSIFEDNIYDRSQENSISLFLVWTKIEILFYIKDFIILIRLSNNDYNTLNFIDWNNRMYVFVDK